MRSRAAMKTFAFLFSLAFLLAPLAAQSFPLAARDDLFGQANLSQYAQKSLAAFSAFTLRNGIPVIVRKSESSRVLHLSLVLRGGSILAKPSEAGLEALALKTMARGSERYSYEAIQDLLDRTSSSLGASSGFDHSSFSLGTLDKYFSELYPLWADCILSPALREADFAQALSEAKLALQSKEQDPWSKAGLEMNKRFFEGHPYAVTPEGKPETLAALDLAAVKRWRAEDFGAERLFVVAVGNFDVADLRNRLEEGLGALPSRNLSLPGPATRFSQGEGGQGRIFTAEHPASKGLAYLRGDFAAPAYGDEDYMAASIAMKMLSDLLFDVVRDRYGAVYSPGASIRGFSANYGSISLYKTSVPGKIKAYVDEAAAELLAGNCVSAADSGAAPGAHGSQGAAGSQGVRAGEAGKPARSTIAEALPLYKARFINEYYSAQETSAEIAAQIAASAILTGDYRSYLLGMDRIEAVRAEDVLAAARKCLSEGAITWVGVGAKDVLGQIKPEDFKTLGGMK